MNIDTNERLQALGQVMTMKIPSSWLTLSHVDLPVASPSWVSYGPVQSADIGVEVCIYNRCRPLASSGQDGLRAVLEMPPGILTSGQLKLLEEVMRDASLIGAFDFWSAVTRDWNGRRVLIIEGRWNELKAARFWMFVPTDTDCNEVQEIWFQAPAESYASHLKQGLEILGTIEWLEQD